MQSRHLYLLFATAIVACADDDDRDDEYAPPGAAESVDTDDAFASSSDEGLREDDELELAGSIDPQSASTDPLLKWVLFAKPGTAKLVNAAGGVIKTHSFANHWIPVSVAGNKLLWQRSDTGLIALWTVDDNGNHVTQTDFPAPASGWKVRGISLDQDGACPLPAIAQRTYTILLEGPATLGGPLGSPLTWPKPRLWHVNDAGVITSTEELPDRFAFNELRDFRFTIDGYAALVRRTSGESSAISWYGRNDADALELLRTDGYSSTAGFSSCTAHRADVQCPAVIEGVAPGAGHKVASFVTTALSGAGQGPAAYVMWSKTDGSNKLFNTPLFSGALLTPMSVPFAADGTVATSFAGKPPAVCPLPPIDPEDPPAFPSNPVVDPPGCPAC